MSAVVEERVKVAEQKADEIVRRRPKRAKEFDSRSVEPNQKSTIVMPPIADPVERKPEIVIPETQLMKDDLEKLAFSEEPIKIFIHRSGEKFSPRTTDLVAVNGIKAEMLFKNGWVQIGYLPRGQEIIVKRKYVEQLAHAKMDNITTVVTGNTGMGEDTVNKVERVTTSVCQFSVLHDPNPKGIEWLSQLLRMQG